MARSKGVVVQINAEENTARAFEAVNARVAALQSQVASLTGSASAPGDRLAAGMGHAVPEIAAASGAIREFEGNLPIRAVERFLTTTLGLGPALSAIFPLVGFVAFAGVIGEGIKKLYELEQTGAHAGKELAKAFDEFTEKLKTANDELDLQNKKLEDEIAKLSGHPSNGLASALADARVEADRLQQSITADIQAFSDLIKAKDSVGVVEGVLSNRASNGGTLKEIADAGEVVRKASKDEQAAYDAALIQAGTDQKKQEAATKQHFDRLADIAAQAASKMRQRATDIANTQKEIDKSFREGQEQGFGAGNPLDLTNQRAPFEDAAQLFDQLQRRAQLQGIHSQDTTTLDRLKGDKEAGEAKRKSDEQAQKLLEAQEKEKAAEVTLADSAAKLKAERQKSADDAELDAVESKYKALLISDEEYYDQKLALQQKTLQAERDKLASERASVSGELSSVQGEPASKDPVKLEEHKAKVAELQAKINDLDARDAELVAQGAKSIKERVDEETALAKVRRESADKVAASLEATRGGSTAARLKQNAEQGQEEFDQAVAQNADPSTLANIAASTNIKADTITAGAADQTYQQKLEGINAQRSAVAGEQSRGQISTQDAQQQRIALNEQEAQAIQQVIAAYQQLANDGVSSATAKVAELQQRVAELRDPINQVAIEVRDQLDGAFEKLFVNMDRGKKALQEFIKTIESDVLKDSYQQFVQPVLQAAAGTLIKGSGATSGVPSASKGGATAAIGGLFGKIVPGLGNVTGAKGGGVQVQIINQSSQPVSGTASQPGGSGDLTDALRGPVLQIILEDLERGGQVGQALGAVGGLLTA